MKLATWNVNSIRARLDLLLDWLGRQRPDIVCLQETKVIDELFPTTQLAEIGYGAREPRDVYDPVAMEGKIHFHVDERAALQLLQDRGLVDAFRRARSEPGLFSWWDYRQGAFRRNLGLRIDHIWVSPDLSEHVT